MKPRIVLLLAVFPQLSETFIVDQFLGLLNAGWDVHILCANFRSENWDAYTALRRQPALRRRVHQTLPFNPRWLAIIAYLPVLLFTLLRHPSGLIRYFKTGWQLHKHAILRRFYLDAPLIWLHPHLIHFEFGALAVGRETLARCLGSKMLVSFRGYDLNFAGLDQPAYYRPLWEHADALHLLGEDLWKRAQARGCPPEKTHALIPPAVDPVYFAPLTEPPEENDPQRPLRILSVGRLEWKKGYEFGLQSIKLLQDQGINCQYHIVGAGSYLECLYFTSHQFAIHQSIQFFGKQTRDQVREHYRWADVFLHSAVSEGFCNAVLEAQAMGIPVVTSDADGLAENVADGLSGYVVPRRHPAALAERLAQLAADPHLRARMGAAGRQRVLAKFTPEKQIAAFDALYQTLLESPHAGD